VINTEVESADDQIAPSFGFSNLFAVVEVVFELSCGVCNVGNRNAAIAETCSGSLAKLVDQSKIQFAKKRKFIVLAAVVKLTSSLGTEENLWNCSAAIGVLILSMLTAFDSVVVNTDARPKRCAPSALPLSFNPSTDLQTEQRVLNFRGIESRLWKSCRLRRTSGKRCRFLERDAAKAAT